MDELTKAGVGALIREAATPFVEAYKSCRDLGTSNRVGVTLNYYTERGCWEGYGSALKSEDFERLERLLELFKGGPGG